MTRRQFSLIGSSIPAAFLVGCAKSPVVPPGPNPPTPAPVDQLAAIEATLAGIEATVAVLGAVGKIDPGTAALIIQALAPIPGDIQQATIELSSADSSAQKALYLNNLLYPQIVALNALPASAQLYVVAIEAGLKAFLAFYPTGTTALPRVTRMTKMDPARLSTILLRAGQADGRLKVLGAK